VHENHKKKVKMHHFMENDSNHVMSAHFLPQNISISRSALQAQVIVICCRRSMDSVNYTL